MRKGLCRFGLAIVFLGFFLLSGIPSGFAEQKKFERLSPILEKVKGESEGSVETKIHESLGTVRHLGTEPGKHIKNPGARVLGRDAHPEQAARIFLEAHGKLFGIDDPSRQLAALKTRKTDRGRSLVRFQQKHRGIPILSGELILQMDEEMNIVSTHGRTVPDFDLDPTPAIDAGKAKEIAIVSAGNWFNRETEGFAATDPQLWIYNPTLIGLSMNHNFLAWRMQVYSVSGNPIHELVLVDAHSGKILLHYNLIETALYRRIADCNNNANSCYWTRVEGDADTNKAQVDLAYEYLGDAYNFYLNYHGRDGRDGMGGNVEAIVRYCTANECPVQNAYGGFPMAFGDGWVTDDVVGHEYTHGVTAYESQLNYYMQSGAINESFSDIWGEFIDLTNSSGNDSWANRWLVSEDKAGGPIRSMQNPPQFNDPDKMTSPHFACYADDNGGVHRNSGVGNKAAYLMVDGGTFNGRSVTGIGLTKTAKIFYEVQTNLLTSGADYADLYDALYQGCLNLLGTSGITIGNCFQVRQAAQAVEMNLPPLYCSTPEAPLCDTGEPAYLFFDDLENPQSGNWTAQTVAGSDGKSYGWYYPQDASPYNWDLHYAVSGLYSLWGDNVDFAAEYSVTSKFISLPAGSHPFLHFQHFFDFASGDGGVLEYQVFLGSWTDAGALFVNNGYNGQLSGSGNPLTGRSGFTGRSNGYISSRLNLSSLAGMTVRFRYRIGNNGAGKAFGWMIDDVRIHTCPTSCTYTIDSSNLSWSSKGGKGSVSVSTQSGCHWAASVGDPWLTLSALVYTGSYFVDYWVAENTGAASRTGTITVAGHSLTVTQEGAITLKEAVDNTGLDYFDSVGAGGWFGQSGVSYYGGDAAQSGPIGENGQSVLYLDLEDAGYLSFYWKVSSEENYDILKIYRNGVQLDAISGEADWRRKIVAIPSGYNLIEWKYEKDGSSFAGADAGWVDKIEFGPCYYDLSQETIAYSNLAGTGSVSVTAPAGCFWTAGSQAAWIQIAGGGTGAGPGTVSYSVSAYAGSTPRTGTITIGGRVLTVTQWGAIPLGEALDNPAFSWTTGGDANWLGYPGNAFAGSSSARSGAINHGQTTWLETSVTGDVFGSFAWRVSSEPNYDSLRFFIDGEEVTYYNNGVETPLRISGLTDWDSVTFYLPAGNHVLRWTYIKDGSVSTNEDCGYVDRICISLNNPVSAGFESPGGPGTVNVSLPSICQWTAISWVNWITITSATSGSGSTTVSYTVASNPGTSPRTGKMYIAGRDFTVTQAGTACGYALTPQNEYFGPGDDGGTFAVSTAGGCSWSAVSQAPWITVNPGGSGAGNGTVSYSIVSNPDTAARIGAITVADATFTVTQAGQTCTYQINPSQASVSHSGVRDSASVIAPTGCAWTATSLDSWISITGGHSGSGNGTVNYSVENNPNLYARTGWMAIAGREFRVDQAATPCTFNLLSTGQNFPGSGGTGSIQVNSVLGCSWSAASQAPWITLTTGESYSGTYIVQYSVSPNPTIYPRSGFLTLAGQTYAVTQDGIPCTYALSPSGLSFPPEGGTAAFELATPDGCTWSAVSGEAWVSFISGSSGTGKGTVEFSLSFNNDPALRSTAITVAGEIFTILQEGTQENLRADLPKTGQTSTYLADDDGEIRAGIPWPNPRFTNPDGTAPVSGDQVRDQLTGLIWSRNANGPGSMDCTPGALKDWRSALVYISCLNDTSYGGNSDWRLPNVVELESLIHSGSSDIKSWLESQGFTDVQPFVYWSSTSAGINPNNAWTVDLWGYVEMFAKTSSYRVWPVRGETSGRARTWKTGQVEEYGTRDDGALQAGLPWPMPRFTVEGDCLLDNLTGLVWPRNPDPAQRNWPDAVAYAGSLSFCSRTDWRLPNRKELMTLVDFGESNNLSWLNARGFANLAVGGYWSSTTYANNSSQAWYGDLWFGSTTAYPKTSSLNVLPVSGGTLGETLIWAAPSSFDFRAVNVNRSSAGQIITLSNLGSGDLEITSMGIQGGDRSMFAVSPGGPAPCSALPFILPFYSSCTLTAAFSPLSAGPKTLIYRIFSNDPGKPVLDLLLTGRGVAAPVLTDFNGDRFTDISAFHLPSDQFFTQYSGNLGQYGWGGPDCYPLVWDPEGSGKTPVSIYHLPTNQWFLKGFPGDNLGQFGWGMDESIPVPGDYDGDGLHGTGFLSLAQQSLVHRRPGPRGLRVERLRMPPLAGRL